MKTFCEKPTRPFRTLAVTIVSAVLVAAMAVPAVSFASGGEQAEYRTEEYDISEDYWEADWNCVAAGEGPVTLDFGGSFGSGIRYSEPIDVSKQVDFTISVDSWTYGGDCWFSFVFGKEEAPVFEDPNRSYDTGISWLFYRKEHELLVYEMPPCQGVVAGWNVLGEMGKDVKFRMIPDTDGWAMYIAQSGSEEYIKEGLVPYDRAPEDFFDGGMAYFGIFIYDPAKEQGNVDDPIMLSVKSFSGLVEAGKPEKTEAPTNEPTEEPTAEPTERPTDAPTAGPTDAPKDNEKKGCGSVVGSTALTACMILLGTVTMFRKKRK